MSALEQTPPSQPQTANPPETPPAAHPGRDARGRFTKGNPGGPGNPFARQIAALRAALCETVTEEDIRAIAQMLKQKALEGDLTATKLLLAYVIGKPVPAENPDTLDLREWRQIQQSTAGGPEISTVLSQLPAEFACDYVGTAWPGVVEQVRQDMLAGLQAMQQAEQEATAQAQQEQDEEEEEDEYDDEDFVPPTMTLEELLHEAEACCRARSANGGKKARPTSPAHAVPDASPDRRPSANAENRGLPPSANAERRCVPSIPPPSANGR